MVGAGVTDDKLALIYKLNLVRELKNVMKQKLGLKITMISILELIKLKLLMEKQFGDIISSDGSNIWFI